MNPAESAYTIFNNALELNDPAARERYVNEACSNDLALRDRVAKLLAADQEAGGFLSQPSKPNATSMIAPVIEGPGDTIGRYKLLEQVGEGGCGIVYMAEQQEPVRRRVALKVIKLGMDTKQVVARFEAERQALALMDHPNIAKVLDAGATSTGRPYFVMELVRGIRITNFCDENKLPTEQRLRLFMRVCQAVQHAHQKGVIHRDIKPSNILVTISDGVPVPKVIDFGIAKATAGRLTDQTVFTAFEQFIGTPAYMSPEQAAMTSLDIDTRTDIYSLGVLLYELLTGRTPFDQAELMAEGLDAMRRTIREQEPDRPSTRLSTMAADALTNAAQQRQTDPPKLIHLVRGDLDWIVMKCLEKDRARRYDTANGLATDIKRHLNNEPVVARPPSKLYEFQKTVRRHKVGFAATAAVIMVLAAGVVTSMRQAVRATHAEREQIGLRQQADEARGRAETAEREAKQQLYTALFEQARATVKSGELGQRVRTLDALRRAAAISNTVELRREALAALALPDLRFKRELLTGSEFTLVQLDPRFERVALGRGQGPVEIRSVSGDRLLASLPASTNRAAHSGRWSANGRFLAIKRDLEPSGARADMEIWEVSSARRILLLRDVPYGLVSFHPRLPEMIATSRDGSAAVWNLKEGTRTTQFKIPGAPSDFSNPSSAPSDLKYSPDGKRFAIRYHSNNFGVISVHNAGDAALLASQSIPRGLHTIDWHPAGHWIAAGGDDGSLNLIDPQTGQSHLLGSHMAAAATMAFSPDGQYLITGGWEKELICWNLETMQRAFTMPLGGYHLQFEAKGRQDAVVIVGKSFQLHAFERPTTHREFAEDLGAPIHHAAFSPDGRWLAASGDKRAGVWDLAAGGSATLEEGAYLTHFFFSVDAPELFGSRNKGVVSDCFRWRLTPASDAGGPPRLEPLPLNRPKDFTSLSLSSNTVVMTSSKGSQVLAPDEVEKGSDRWMRTQLGINGVSPDGRWLATYLPYTPALYIYRLPELERVAKLTHPANINNFEFSPFADEVAIWSSRGGVEFWSTTSWARTRALTNFTGVLYASDAQSLWLRKDWRTAGLFDAQTLKPQLLLPAGMLPLALSPDGRQLAVSVNAQRLQVWDLAEVRRQLRELGLDWAEARSEAPTPKR